MAALISESHLWILFSFSLLKLTSADQKNITAQSGQDVTLTCQAPNNNITVLEWSRADLGDEFVFVYRNNQVLPDQHPSFKNRVDLQDKEMNHGNMAVILNNVTINDTGTYECRVIMNETWKNINIIYLHVVPPGQPGGATEDGGNSRSVGLIIILVLLAVLLIAAVFWIYSKRKEQNQDPYQPPAETHHV